jgi:hypothetical protein
MSKTNTSKTWRETLSDFLLFSMVFGLTNVISYGFIVVAGRHLEAIEYGKFSVLVGFIALGGVFANAIQAGATQAVKAGKDIPTIKNIIASTGQYSLFGPAVIAAILVYYKHALTVSYLQIAICGVCLFAMINTSAVFGYLAGIGKVRAQADLALVGAVAKLGVGWSLMLGGFGVSGALAGYAASYIIILPLAILLGVRTAESFDDIKIKNDRAIKIEMPTLLIFLLTYATFALDQFVVQFFNPTLGGEYAAAATMAKLSFFSTFPIIAIAFPRMLMQAAAPERVKTLILAAGTISFIGGGLVAALYLFPHELKNLFFGARFEAAATNAAMLALGVSFFSMSVLAVHAKISWKNTSSYILPISVLAGAVMLHANRHQDLKQISENQTFIYFVQMVVLWAGLLYSLRKQSTTLKRSANA